MFLFNDSSYFYLYLTFDAYEIEKNFILVGSLTANFFQAKYV